MHSANRILLVLITIFYSSLASAFVAQANDNPLSERPWPKGEKVPCKCDILAIDYELCLKGIGEKECFKEAENVIPKEEKTEEPKSPGVSNPVIYPVVIPCHELGAWLENMQNDFQLYPFAQGKAIVRHGQTYEFAKPDMLMMVNPLTNNFAMLGVWPNGYACLLASGDEFKMLVKP